MFMILILLFVFLMTYWLMMMPYFYSAFKEDSRLKLLPTSKKVYYTVIWPIMVFYGWLINKRNR